MSNLHYIRRKQTSRYVLTITNLEDYVKLWDAQNNINVSPPTYPAYNTVVNTLDAVRTPSQINNSFVSNTGIPNSNQYLFEPMFGPSTPVIVKVPDFSIQDIYDKNAYFSSPSMVSRWKNSASSLNTNVASFGGIYVDVQTTNFGGGHPSTIGAFKSLPNIIVWKTLPRLRIPAEATITNIKITFQKMQSSTAGPKNMSGSWVLFKKKQPGDSNYNSANALSISEVNPDLASPYVTWNTWNWRVYFYNAMGNNTAYNDEVNFFPTSGGNWNTSDGNTLGLEEPFTEGLTPTDFNNGNVGLVYIVRGFDFNEWIQSQLNTIAMRNITLTVSIS